MGLENFCVQKYFGAKKFWVQKILNPKNVAARKMSGQQILRLQNVFDPKILGSKNSSNKK